MLCLFSCLLGWKNLPFLKEISVQSPIHWTHRVLVFHTAQSTAQLLSQQRYHCAMKGSQGQISLSPKWRQQREANSSWASQRAAHWEWCSQSWEISGTRQEGWEEGQGDLGRGLEVLKVRRELRLQRGWLPCNWAWENSRMEREREVGLVWLLWPLPAVPALQWPCVLWTGHGGHLAQWLSAAFPLPSVCSISIFGHFGTSFSQGPAKMWEQVQVTTSPCDLCFNPALLMVGCWHSGPLKVPRNWVFLVLTLLSPAAKGFSCSFELSLLFLSCPQPPDPQETLEKDESNSVLIIWRKKYPLDREYYFTSRFSRFRFNFCPEGNLKWLNTSR